MSRIVRNFAQSTEGMVSWQFSPKIRLWCFLYVIYRVEEVRCTGSAMWIGFNLFGYIEPYFLTS